MAAKRPAPRTRKVGLADRRTNAVYEAARDLLAERDYDDISIAELVKAGDCSIGAFYGRFPDKERFLTFVIGLTFDGATKRAQEGCQRNSSRTLSGDQFARWVAEIIAMEMADPKTAGVTRAALKLAATRPEAAKPLLRYREAVGEAAADMAAKTFKGRGTRQRARESIQIVFATLIDSILQDSGPLTLGSRKMNAALQGIALAHMSAAPGKQSGAEKL